MTRSTALRTLLAFVAGVAFVGAVALVDQSFQDRANDVPDAARGGPPAAERDKEENEEKEEQGEKLERRLEALEAAERKGKVGQSRTAAAGPPSAGWAGETHSTRQPMTGSPRSRQTRRHRGSTPSSPATAGASRVPATARRRTSPCASAATADDVWTIKAAVRLQGRQQVRPDHRGSPPDRQRLRAAHERLRRFFVNTTDHGATWTRPVKTYGNVAGTTSRSSQ